MVSTQHTQSVTDFRRNATETLERLARTGEAEILTVNGEAKAVMMSPAAYDAMVREWQLNEDVKNIRKSMKQIDEGNWIEAGEFFDGLRAKLLKMKAGQEKGKGN